MRGKHKLGDLHRPAANAVLSNDDLGCDPESGAGFFGVMF
jgi:hypothetical protein